MFDSLSDKLQTAFDGLKRQGKLTDKDVERAAREIRLALLEADVNYKVVKEFVEQVKERALGAEVLDSLTPAQQFIKIVNEELVALMGSSTTKLTFSPRLPTVIMMVGLQGSGKTTACGKLANFLLAQGKSPALVAGDVYRPAAVDQLKTLGQQLGVPVYDEGTEADPVDIAKHGVDWARDKGRDVLIVDTAGTAAHRREADGRAGAHPQHGQAAQHPAGAGRHDRSGRRECGPAVPGAGAVRRGDPHQDGRRRPGWCRALGTGRDRQADQVRQQRREARQFRVFPPGPRGFAHPGHGRRALAHRESRAHHRREEGAGVGAAPAQEHASPSTTSSSRSSRYARWDRSPASSA